MTVQNKDKALEGLYRFHALTDQKSQTLAAHHRDRLQCGRGCSQCCVDDLTVFEVEAARIQRHCAEILDNEAPRPPGACAFLDEEGACRIYEHRPYVCRTQGLPLRWLEPDEDEDGALIEYRDICPLNEEGEPLETLAAEVCWTIGEHESELATLQIGHGGAEMKRIALRELFSKKK